MFSTNESLMYNFNEVEVQEDIIKAIEILSQKAPSNSQVQESNQIVIEHLKKSETLSVLLRVLVIVSENENQVHLVLNFLGYYLNVQCRHGIGIIRHSKEEIAEKIKNVFVCKSLSNKSKNILQHSFSIFLSTLDLEFMKLRKKLSQEIIEFFTLSKNLTPEDLHDSLFLVEALLTDSLEMENLIALEDTLLIRFIQLSIKLIRELDDELVKDQNRNCYQEQLNRVTWTQKILQITQILFKRAKSEKLIALKMKVSISSELAHICDIGLKLSHQRNQFIFEFENYENPEQQTFYKKIDEIKLNILAIANNSFEFLLKSRRNLADSKFIPVIEIAKSFITEIIPMIVKTLSGYPTKMIKNTTNIQEGLNLLAKLIKIPILLNEFTEIRDEVLWKVCLPCFITTSNEKQMPCEDFCDQKEKNIAAEEPLNMTQAAVLVAESYFDHIYGTIPITAKALINLMDFQLTADPKYFEEIPELLSSSEFYQNFTYFEQFEACFSVMSAMSYHAENREDVTILFEEFIIRRQEFFSRIDVPSEMIVSFLQCCAYYLENFYQLILEGKANADFHCALIFHSAELLAYSFDEESKAFKNNDVGKIGTQAIDYLSNSLIQELFFSAIFPASNPKSTSFLISLIQKISAFINSSFNMKIIENVLIDFIVKCTDRHFEDKSLFISMPEPLRTEICEILVDGVINNFNPNLNNEMIAKKKLLELLSLIIRICKEPTKLMTKSLELFNHIIEEEITFIEELLTISEVYLKRSENESLNLTSELLFTFSKLAKKSLKICDYDTVNVSVFSLYLNLNLLKVSQEEITLTLLETFEERLAEKEQNTEAEFVLEKILYLLLQISYENFFSVSPQIWLEVLRKMTDYMRIHYDQKDTTTIGKSAAICLACYIQDPSGVENVLGNRMEGLWDCILDDQLKYETTAEKRMICILLIRLLEEHSSKPIIQHKSTSILTTICIIMFYLYEKDELLWMENEDDESESEKDPQNDSNDELFREKVWKEKAYTMKENPFLTHLSDDREMLKNLCFKLNETDHNKFVKFVNELPIGIQNLVKNKIFLYKSDTAVANKKTMRTIYKVRMHDEERVKKQEDKAMEESKQP